MADNSGSSNGESSDSPTTSFLKCRENVLSPSDDIDSTVSSVTELQNIKTRFQEPGFNLDRSESWMIFPVLSDETVRAMVEKESEHLPKYDYLYRLRSGDLDLIARDDALDWILEVCLNLVFLNGVL